MGICSRLGVTLRRVAISVAVAALGMSGGAHALETLRVGKPQAAVFSFTPLDIGTEKGIFTKHGVEIETVNLGGAGKLQQALAAGAIDVGLGSGPALSFVAKGAPQLGIATMAGPPLLFVLVVKRDGPIASVADLKGRTLAIPSLGGSTEWLIRELSRSEGWGPDGINLATLGTDSAEIAALRLNQIDGFPTELPSALLLEREAEGRIVFSFGKIAPNFILHVIFASDSAMASKPEALRDFLAGWFETIAYMRSNKAAAVRIAARATDTPEDIVGRTYDEVMPMFSSDGRFDPKALAVLARSFVELKLLPEEPDMKKLYTERFLPAMAEN